MINLNFRLNAAITSPTSWKVITWNLQSIQDSMFWTIGRRQRYSLSFRGLHQPLCPSPASLGPGARHSELISVAPGGELQTGKQLWLRQNFRACSFSLLCSQLSQFISNLFPNFLLIKSNSLKALTSTVDYPIPKSHPNVRESQSFPNHTLPSVSDLTLS